MKRLLISVLLLSACSIVCSATITQFSGTAWPLTISAATGNAVIAISDGSVAPASMSLNTSGALTKLWCHPRTTINTICIWYILSSPGTRTSITCTTCGSVFAATAYVVTDGDNSSIANLIDHIVPCYALNVPCTVASGVLTYNPGLSSEYVVFASNCTGSATSITATGTTLTKVFPNGEPRGVGSASAGTTVTAGPDSGCGGESGFIFGIKKTGATQSCVMDAGLFDYGAEVIGAGNPTVTALVSQAGNLIVANPWCITSCTITAVTVGGNTATLAVAGNSDASSGQPYIYYVLSASAAGSQAITATLSTTPTDSQIAYQEFVPSQGCTVSHDVDASVGTGNGATANTPSITPTTGDTLFNFTAAHLHVQPAPTGGSWVCNDFLNASGQTGDCTYVNTRNAHAYILQAAAGTTANNMSIISGDWQALITSFKLTGSGGGGPAAIGFSKQKKLDKLD